MVVQKCRNAPYITWTIVSVDVKTPHGLQRERDGYAEQEVRAAKRVEEEDHDYERTSVTGSSSD